MADKPDHTCRHYPDQITLGRGQSHDLQGPEGVMIECQCGKRWHFVRSKEAMTRQELEEFYARGT